jgi:hypothetical protein
MREGGRIFRLSRYLGHSSVKITERVYAHMIPEDFEQDWDCNCLRVGTEGHRQADLGRLAVDDQDADPDPPSPRIFSGIFSCILLGDMSI